MKKLIIATVLFMVCLLASKELRHRADAEAHEKQPTPSKHYLSLSKEAKSFKGLPAEMHATATLTDCEKFDDTISHEPLETSLYDIKSGALKIPPLCKFADPAMTNLYDALLAKCATTVSTKNQQDCSNALFMYRTVTVEQATIGHALADLPTDVLAQKFFALMFGQRLKTPDGNAEARALIAELKNRDAISPVPDRMDLVRLLSAETLGKDAAVDAAIAKARQNEPDDTGLYELQLMSEREKNFADYEKDVESQYQNDQSNVIATYHMGCVAWKHGQRDVAVSYFEKALALAPNDARFNETLGKAKSLPLSEAVCVVTIAVSPDQL